jgi:hypothetical protein
MRVSRLVGALVAAASLVVVSFTVPAAAVASTTPYLGIGTMSLATPASGGRYIYVATNGSDTVSEYKTWLNGDDTYNRMNCLEDPNYLNEGKTSQTTCPEPDASHPLRNIETAIRVAKAGDVIVVRAGSYNESLGYGAVSGTSSHHIVMQSYPGEKVLMYGTLMLHSPSYWTVEGFHFVYNKAVQGSGEAIVLLDGGTNWIFQNNEIRGSVGYANLIIQSDKAANSSVAALTAAAPKNWLVSGNCIHDNNGNDAQGLDHNIYLTGSIYQSGGMIEHNLLADAPRGSDIKAAASGESVANNSPANVIIDYNTMTTAASGVTLGLGAKYMKVDYNIIVQPQNAQAVDGGIHTWELAKPTTSSIKDDVFYGWPVSIHEEYGQVGHLVTANNVKSNPSFTGSVTSCNLKPSSSSVATRYGQYAGF